jgi:thiol-disulfide isomerase/thioredoxin
MSDPSPVRSFRTLDAPACWLVIGLCAVVAALQLIGMARHLHTGPRREEPVPAYGQAEIVYFGEPTCPACQAAAPAIAELQRRYPQYRLARVDVSIPAGDALQQQYYRAYKVPKRDRDRIPIAFAGKRYFMGTTAVTDDLRRYLSAGPLPRPAAPVRSASRQ